jgi:hypothetical protein
VVVSQATMSSSLNKKALSKEYDNQSKNNNQNVADSKVTQIVNQDLQKLNLRIQNTVNWKMALKSSSGNENIEFELVEKDKSIGT